MRALRFIAYLVGPIFAPLLILPLAAAWLVLSLIVFVWETWDKAAGR